MWNKVTTSLLLNCVFHLLSELVPKESSASTSDHVINEHLKHAFSQTFVFITLTSIHTGPCKLKTVSFFFSFLLAFSSLKLQVSQEYVENGL